MVNHDSIYKVSIIVPAYNVEQYIGKCLDSLIGIFVIHTNNNTEILLRWNIADIVGFLRGA